MPTLSKTDKRLYYILEIVVCLLYAAAVISSVALWNKLFFSDTEVIATSMRFTFLFTTPFIIYMAISIVAPIFEARQKRKPIFGRKDVRYGQGALPPIYPVFYKDKPPMTDKRKKELKSSFFLWLGGFLLTVFIAGFGIFGRWVLTEDFTTNKYSVMNNCIESISLDSCQELRFATGSTPGVGRYKIDRHFFYVAFVTAEGEEILFTHDDFRSNTDALREMLRLKEEAPEDKVTIEIYEDLDTIIEYNAFTDDEAKMLNELFEQ